MIYKNNNNNNSKQELYNTKNSRNSKGIIHHACVSLSTILFIDHDKEEEYKYIYI